MKLNSKYLKELILEVIDEATRRDFLKGAAGVAGLAALGKGISSLYDDEEENPLNTKDNYEDAPVMTRQSAIDAGLNPDEFFPPEGEEKEQFPLDPVGESEWKEEPSPYTKSEGKYALDRLRFTPENLEFYGVAPSQDAFGDYMAYVDIEMIYDMAEKDPEIADALVKSEGFYSDFTLKQQFSYVFGSKTFWGTFNDPDNPNSRQLMPVLKTTNNDGEKVNLAILPLAWTASLDHWIVRFENLESRLQQHPTKRNEILSEADLTEEEYELMKEKYFDVTGRMGDGAIVANPNYNPKEEQ